MAVIWMVVDVLDVESRVGETEKMTIDPGAVDPGQIDLLVQGGSYSNRTDPSHTAIRNQLVVRAEPVANRSPLAK